MRHSIVHGPDFHTDAFRRLLLDGGVKEVRWVALRDRIVTCDLRIHSLARNSFDPLVMEILEHLRTARQEATLEQLGLLIGCSGRAGLRVIAEILHVLRRAGEVVVTTDGRFRAASQSKWSNARAREQVIDTRVRYVPRSDQLGPSISGWRDDDIQVFAGLEGVQWWHPSDEEDLYHEDSLTEGIQRVYSLQNAGKLPPIGDTEDRIEVLQRSQLVSTGLKFIGCSVIRSAPLPFWILHRCYLFRSQAPGREGWNIRVFRYPHGGERHGYTRYFHRLRNTNEDFINRLCEVSMPVH